MTEIAFRQGTPGDSSDLAILFDAASRRMCAWYWGTIAAPGQSWLEVGRDRIRNLTDLTSHHSKWHVAEQQGETVGAIFGFSIPDPYDRVDLTEVEEVLHPMIALEITAKGCWLLQAIALFTEHRGKGYGPALIEQACRTAQAAGHRRIVLQVESPNTGALALYRKCGFTEWQRLPFLPFPGSEDRGDWILMARDL